MFKFEFSLSFINRISHQWWWLFLTYRLSSLGVLYLPFTITRVSPVLLMGPCCSSVQFLCSVFCVFTFWVPCCGFRYDFRTKRCSVRLYLKLIVGGQLIMLYVFVCIVLCFCFVCLRLVCPLFPVSLDFPFFIASSVFSNFYGRHDIMLLSLIFIVYRCDNSFHLNLLSKDMVFAVLIFVVYWFLLNHWYLVSRLSLPIEHDEGLLLVFNCMPLHKWWCFYYYHWVPQ